VSDLVEFLRARLDEDEEIARRNMSPIRPRQGKWQFVTDSGMQVRDADGDHLIVTHTWPNEGEHIAHWDPAHVLVEIDAKRRIIDLHGYTTAHGWVIGVDRTCTECATGYPGSGPADEGDFDPTPWPCPTLRLLALPYVDHPDYRDEWKP
jgi:hypothetical protein